MAKEKLGMAGCGSPDRRPCFYKIFLSNLIDLRIPPDFKKHFLSVETDQATLRSPCGNWDVELRRDDKGDMYFAEGWEEFLKCHSVDILDFLFFQYNGDMSFDVLIFDQSRGDGKSHQESPSSCRPSFPFFKRTMKDYNIGSKSTLLIPRKFSRSHFHLSSQMIILRNSKGVSWSASITISSRKKVSISGGWKAFADDNSIKKGDICIFELVEKNTLQVQILK